MPERKRFFSIEVFPKSDLQGESNLDQFAWGWRPVARWILSIFIAIIIKIFIIIFHHLQLSPSSSFNICHHIVILGGRGGHNPIIINVITKFIIYNDHHHYRFCNQSSFCHQVDVAGKNCALLKKPETKTKMCNIHCTLRSDNVDNDNDGGDSSDDGEDGNDASGTRNSSWRLSGEQLGREKSRTLLGKVRSRDPKCHLPGSE